MAKSGVKTLWYVIKIITPIYQILKQNSKFWTINQWTARSASNLDTPTLKTLSDREELLKISRDGKDRKAKLHPEVDMHLIKGLIVFFVNNAQTCLCADSFYFLICCSLQTNGFLDAIIFRVVFFQIIIENLLS